MRVWVPVNGELVDFEDLTPEQQAKVKAEFVRVFQEATNQLYGVRDVGAKKEAP